MVQSFLIKYAEIAIKGKNRKLFEEALVRQIRYAMKKTDSTFSIRRTQGRIFVDMEGDYDADEVISKLKKVFGIVGICPVALREDRGIDKLALDVVEFIRQSYDSYDFTFKVSARRARKNFPLNSMEINAYIGEKILDAFPDMKVDVHSPCEVINIEIREQICIYSKVIEGPGGMPVGTSGKAMLLLSGGIDSPVAGHMIAKRGCKVDAIYFHAPPYTSERARQKVVDLAGIISEYAGPVYLKVVNFTDIQMKIYEVCPHDQLTIIMRRYMMRIAEHFAKETESLGLVTGESIGQVASQTMQSLMTTDAAVSMPVYRPLIGFDKSEIIERSRRIGAFETSILPYEDCCTIFVAKHPVTKPTLKSIEKSEALLLGKIEELYDEAIRTTKTIVVRGKNVSEC